MIEDLTPFFEKYETLLQAADNAFGKIRQQYPNCVRCDAGCSDCCHALFDLSLIEALYINHHFHQHFEGLDAEKEALLENANKIDRQLFKIKKQAHKAVLAGEKEEDILAKLAQERVRCPLLGEDNLCRLYNFRPITCRFYGVPTAINGKGHCCGLSAFKKGEPYPTVNLDLINQKLRDLSLELAKSIGSRYPNLGEILIPLSMALLTVEEESFLGIENDDTSTETEKKNG